MSGLPPSPLHAAVRVADLIRTSIRHRGEDGTSASVDEAAAAATDLSVFLPPGLVDGVVAGGAALAILTPVRSRLIRYAGNRWGMLPDLLISSSQGVASATAALYMGSLQGSRFYLKKLAGADPNLDGWVPEVCDSADVRMLLNRAQRSSAGELEWMGNESQSIEVPTYHFSQDPRRQTLEALAKALETCRRLSDSHSDDYIGPT